jgi:hypothetical protein
MGIQVWHITDGTIALKWSDWVAAVTTGRAPRTGNYVTTSSIPQNTGKQENQHPWQDSNPHSSHSFPPVTKQQERAMSGTAISSTTALTDGGHPGPMTPASAHYEISLTAFREFT